MLLNIDLRRKRSRVKNADKSTSMKLLTQAFLICNTWISERHASDCKSRYLTNRIIKVKGIIISSMHRKSPNAPGSVCVEGKMCQHKGSKGDVPPMQSNRESINVRQQSYQTGFFTSDCEVVVLPSCKDSDKSERIADILRGTCMPRDLQPNFDGN